MEKCLIKSETLKEKMLNEKHGSKRKYKEDYNRFNLICSQKQVFQKTVEVVWYSYFFQYLSHFVAIHTIEGFTVVNNAEVDIILKLLCFLHDPVNVGNLIYSSSGKSSLYLCLERDQYQRMQAMIYAIEEINKNPDLLPNITLGYQIFDTCTVLRRAMEGTLWMLSGRKEIIPNYRCEPTVTFAGIVGDSGSTRSIQMAHILGLYRYPQISYFLTSPTLSNRKIFPSFFRTIPSDVFQSRGLANLILYFGWSWVGFLANDNDYGQLSLQVIKQELINAGACVAFIETIMTGQANRNAPHIVKVIKESTAKVVVVLSSNPDLLPVVEELARQNVTDRIWIASEAWSTSNILSKEKYQHVLVGTLGFAVRGGQLPGFAQYIYSLHPSKAPNNSFIIELWEEIFSCKWTNNLSSDDRTSNTTAHDCTGEETLGKSKLKVDFGITFNVYTAVYAFAWALESLLHCQPGKGPFHNGCANILSFDPWQVCYLHFSQS
ncbi:vomeronasal type-2 receptor 1-like [Lithobates pipiens]